LTLVSNLKVPLPRFSLSREDQDDDTSFLARVEQEARNIVGSYMRGDHEACVAGLQNNGRLNHVLELTRVAYGPRPAPVSVEVLKKRKVDASGKVLAKCPKAPEKKGAEPAKVAATRGMGGLKWPLDADILPAKSTMVGKGIIPRTIASTATVCTTPDAHGSMNLFSASGCTAGGRGPGSKTVSE
jgi:hypothetical protein